MGQELTKSIHRQNKINNYVKNHRKNSLNNYNDKGGYISKRRMKKWAMKTIYNNHNKKKHVYSRSERHFRKIRPIKILR